MESMIQIFLSERGIAPSTRTGYIASVQLYEKLNDSTLDALILEAEREEEEGIRWKHRTLKKRLINFRNHLMTTLKESSAKIYFNKIKSIYNHFEIEIGKLPYFKSNNVNKSHVVTYEELPTREEILQGYYSANNTLKTIILLASSSGMSRIDMLNLTVSDFLTACRDYVDSTGTVLDQLRELHGRDDLIPTFRMSRQKTTKPYITFCSPECATHIVHLIFQNQSFNESDNVFKCKGSTLNLWFKDLNNTLGLGKVGEYVKLRCHMLRKYHASTLINAKNGFTVEEVDTLQGRSKDMTHRSYFMEREASLKQKYIACLDELAILHRNQADVIELKNENENYKKELAKQAELLEQLQQNQLKLQELLK